MRYHLYIFFRWIIIISVLSVSCVDENITNISENLDINSCYSIPVGDIEYSINDYFESLDTIQTDTLQLDSLSLLFPDSVIFNDTIYSNVRYIFDTSTVTEFDFSNLPNDIDKVKAVTFILTIISEFPTETWSQVYFADGSLSVLDSVISDGPIIIPAPDLDNNGIPLNKSPVIRICPVSDYIIENLADIRYILVYGAVKTVRTDVNVVKFYPEYMLNIHIGVRVELEFSTSEL